MTGKPVPLFDGTAEYEMNREDYLKVLDDVLRSGQFILGPHVREFEDEVGSYLGARHAIGVNSGTDALVISLRALGVGTGDEVIVPSFTFFASAEAISSVGASPVFVDIEPMSLNLDATSVEAAITERTSAIMPVHLFGRAADMNRLLDVAARNRLAVIEDTAQAFGASSAGRKLGTLGAAGAFSFFPTKNLGGFGDGGLVVTDDDGAADEVRKLRSHGSLVKYRNEKLGYNSRLDELQAALLRVKLGSIDESNAGRREAAALYDELLTDIDLVTRPELMSSDVHVFHQYTIRITEGLRDDVRATLAAKGISTGLYYPTPVHLLPVYAPLGYRLPDTELAAAEVLSLPMWPAIPAGTIERVAEAVREALPQ